MNDDLWTLPGPERRVTLGNDGDPAGPAQLSVVEGVEGGLARGIQGFTTTRPACCFDSNDSNSVRRAIRRISRERTVRTPLDCAYWLKYKRGRFECKTFKTPEECRAHVSSLAKGKSADEVTTEIDPEAEIKAAEAAAELLAELGLDDSAADFHKPW
ncbi:hypothetical protein THAOC_18056 [Thalassiosira oceanica]|uniref:Uncharacterized protein n=1 Tax=Thalassiosira oceanica TaxID=159749 RepID=K0S929_THAOC|nr:hypothetical protein THAOC_18056 [Thalassiosira oceanica]|eukprot:EJK61454.1 hypothetical protein THAOC_18056 [Thalassiosira oceanica]